MLITLWVSLVWKVPWLFLRVRVINVMWQSDTAGGSLRSGRLLAGNALSLGVVARPELAEIRNPSMAV